MYEFAKEDILEVEIEHPTIGEFKSLGLRWYAIPAISNFRMDIGGVTYGCIPFNRPLAKGTFAPWEKGKG